MTEFNQPMGGNNHTAVGNATALDEYASASDVIDQDLIYYVDSGAADVYVITPATPGAVPLMGKAGDCILFPHSLWHGPGPNTSGRARKTLLYNYCQLFMRPYDYESVSMVIDRCSPRQRRLLGDLGYDFRPGSYTYVPEDQLEVILNTPTDA